MRPANIHDRQMLPMLLDPETAEDYFCADSAYAGKCFKDLHEKGSRNQPLSESAKERIRKNQQSEPE